MGCVTQIGEQGWNIGRMAPMVAGWPETVCGTTVDRQCGSSMQTNFNAAAAVWAGQLDVVVSAGVEMMSRVPMGSNGGDLSDKLLERWQIVPQGISAEALASSGTCRARQLDAFSLESHRRAIAAIDDGRFENEIVPVEVGAAGAAVLFAVDEAPRRDTSAEKLASLAARLPAGRCRHRRQLEPDRRRRRGGARRERSGRRPARASSRAPASSPSGSSGVDPYRMLHGNPEACRKALAKAGLGWDDISVIEVNEAFASVVLQFAHDAGLEDRFDDINPNGGGISLGHPLGATGARVTATLLNELERREARYGIACMCIGFGQAIAAVVERAAAPRPRAARRLAPRWSTPSTTGADLRRRPRRCRRRPAGAVPDPACHASAIGARGIVGLDLQHAHPSSFRSTVSSGTSAAPKPAPTSPCTVPLSSRAEGDVDGHARAARPLPRRARCSGRRGSRSASGRRDRDARALEAAQLVVGGDEQHVRVAQDLRDSNGPSSVGSIANASSSSPRSTSRSRSSSDVDSAARARRGPGGEEAPHHAPGAPSRRHSGTSRCAARRRACERAAMSAERRGAAR